MIVSFMYIWSFQSFPFSFSKAFFFGFVLNEVTYNEERDEGVQKLQYSPAPGNITEKSFNFSLNLDDPRGGFVLGGRSK